MKQRDPRAHWFLLAFGCFLLSCILLMNGYVSGAVGEVPRKPVDESGQAPPEVTQGGPVVNTQDGDLRSVHMPRKTIALTFDDGPDPRWTPQILDVLKKHNARGSFFMVGGNVAKHPELVQRVLAEGHEIGNHTYTHADLADAPEWRIKLELNLTQRALAGAAGVKTTLMRLPYSGSPLGTTGAQWKAAQVVGDSGYLVVFTDGDTKDWQHPGVDTMVASAVDSAKGGRGAIIMLHDAGGDRADVVKAVDKIITTLQPKGYQFTTLAEALKLPRSEVAASDQDQMIGKTLVFTQNFAGWLVNALAVLFGVAGVACVLRLVVLIGFAHVHVRRVRERKKDDLPEISPSLTVIVPAYNEEVGIAATLRSLQDNDYPGELEIIVVNDGSDDRTSEIVGEMTGPGLRLIDKENGGKPSALNAGIAAARGDVIVMMDGDTVFQRDTLRKLVQPFTDPKVGAISGNAKVANRDGIWGRWQHIEYVIGFNLDRRMFDLMQCMPTIPGAIGAFRKEVLDAVGGLSDDTLAEDTDLTMSISRSGWHVVYEETAIAWTEAPSSLQQLWRQRYRWCYGTIQAMWKHRSSLRESFGRRCLSYLVGFQVLLPLIAPAVDIYTLYGVLFGDPVKSLVTWLVFVLLQAVAGAYALHLDRERVHPLWALPLQQFVYRQLMYLVVIQSLVTAVMGNRLAWQTIRRTGTFADPDSAVGRHMAAERRDDAKREDKTTTHA
ncbi:bifunctional polysaccharide deacetylase/glycosyltransferase family 2 protein [Actinocorallia populi]|uniref:bifunctional polysaccharide deacetylase/glycosyltransferase family 2 protein n=1 Tax=Actinocorallia populi TaxID=2079200 RepID=UPI000D08F802|nr:bifunctional polysaccharide deacetylase/glycosyltransferase family 2 protein [Actinocorallia populi]